MALEFAAPREFVRDLPWLMLTSMGRTLLPQLPPDLKTALRPFIVPKRRKRTVREAWDMGVKAAFLDVAQEIAKAKGEAA